MKNRNTSGTQVLFDENGNFTTSLPLSFFLGFAEDYEKIIVHARQRLVLILSMEDKNCYHTAPAENCNITVNHVSRRIPLLTPGDKERLKLLKIVDERKWLQIPFRSWEHFEYPLLPQTNTHMWTIRSSSTLEKPRYVIFGFQTGQKDTASKSTSEFDHCNLNSIKLYIENEAYPYMTLHESFTEDRYHILYRMFATFQESYYGRGKGKHCIVPSDFKNKAPLAVIDCSRQNDRVKNGSVNFRLEFQTGN